MPRHAQTGFGARQGHAKDDKQVVLLNKAFFTVTFLYAVTIAHDGLYAIAAHLAAPFFAAEASNWKLRNTPQRLDAQPFEKLRAEWCFGHNLKAGRHTIRRTAVLRTFICPDCSHFSASSGIWRREKPA